jgi:Holliday junction resolvase RusA-like endonuclease
MEGGAGNGGDFFEYVVYGRPASTQPVSRGSGRGPKKPSNLPKWRERVGKAIEEAWIAYSQDFFIDPLRLDLIWIYDAKVPNDPDLDNIVKPFIDALEGRLYEEDSAFKEMHLFKHSLEMRVLENWATERFVAAFGSKQEFVYIRVSPIKR